MRISAEPSDPGNVNYDPDKDYAITLDGKPITGVITADEEEGYVIYMEGYPDTTAIVRRPGVVRIQ